MLIAVIIVLTLLLCGSTWLNVKVVRQNLALSDQREDMVDQIEASLDLLDQVYRRFAHHVTVPVMSDEPIVHEVVHDLKLARNTILAVASKIVTYGTGDEADRNRPGDDDNA